MEFVKKLQEIKEKWEPYHKEKVQKNLGPIMDSLLEKIQNHNFKRVRRFSTTIYGSDFKCENIQISKQGDNIVEYLKEGLGSIFDVSGNFNCTSVGDPEFEIFYAIDVVLREM